MTILVAYSEIALKSRYVRNRLERMLAEHIGFALRRKGFEDFQVLRRFGRLYVEGVPQEAAAFVAKVFGVASAMPAHRTDSSLDSVIGLMVDVAAGAIKGGESFAIRPKVVGEHPYSSRDLAVKGGSAVLEALSDREVRVNLDEPDVTLHVEVRDRDAFVYTRIVPGVLGLPYGSQGRMVSLFSGGIDSPVAAWLMMKRGVAVLPLLMDQRPWVGEGYIERAEDAFRSIMEYAPVADFDLYVAPMGGVMGAIMESPEPRFRCVLCKRAMYRIASAFAREKKAKGVITGESLGQVASQTLDNLYVLDEAAEMPVIRPVIGLDKVEIEDVARRIGTYEVSAVRVDGCKVVPGKPATRSSTEKIYDLEERLDLKRLCLEAAARIERRVFG